MNIAGILYEQDMEARLERKKTNLYSKQTLLVACFRRYVFYAFHGRFVRSITDQKQNPLIDQKSQGVSVHVREAQNNPIDTAYGFRGIPT